MRQPWSIHHKRKLLKTKRASTPPTLPPTCENSETTSITNNNNNNQHRNVVVGFKGSYLPSAFTDSIRSEEGSEGDFFLPFDEEDEESTLSSSRSISSSNAAEQQQQRQQQRNNRQEKQKNRNQAMALLGEFFSLGNLEEEDENSDETKSTSTMATTTKVANAAATAVAIHYSPTSVMHFDAAAESISSPSSSPQFMALSRANSLPLERRSCNNSSVSTTHLGGLTKRPSLKKISSIGKFHTSQSENSLKRSVSFSKVAMREYNVALSDHPSCSYGPPVQLSWDYQEKEEQNLDSYENTRQRQRKGSVNDLVLSYYDRRFMLIKQAGYSKREVKEAVKEVERVKRERMVTDLFLPASHLEETIGAVVDTVKGVFQQQRPEC